MKSTSISIIVAIAIIGIAFYFVNTYNTPTQKEVVSVKNNIPANNVSIVDGKQIIEIQARGGYSPRFSTAKANIPTVIRFNTNGTFDCSAYIRIPSMKLAKMLPNTAATDIDLGAQKVGTLQGMCGMGMYRFDIKFE